MHVQHARQKLMINVITWLFAVGTIITAFNLYTTYTGNFVAQRAIFGQLTVGDASLVSGWAIFFAGFFYALVVVKPEMLKRQRENMTMALKLEAAENPDMYDAATDVYSRQYFERLLEAYFREFKELGQNLSVFSVKIVCDQALQDYALSGAARAVQLILVEHNQNAILARVDDCTLAILSPYMERNEAAKFEGLLYAAVANSKHLPFMAKCDVDHADYPNYAKTAEGTIRGIFAALSVRQNPENPKIEVMLGQTAHA